MLMLTAPRLLQPHVEATSPPKPPTTGTPKGNSTPGTTRPATTCKQTNQPLTAINANNGSDFTISANPSFWFYVPYSQDEVKTAEFLLLDGQEHNTLYHGAVKLAAKPGLIKISLPANSPHSLQPNQNYRWYLLLKCQASHSDEPDAVVDGWIQRKIVDSDRVHNLTLDKSQSLNFYTKNNIWYDAVNHLAELHFQYPDDAAIQAAWNNLLQLLGKQWVAQETFIGSTTVTSDGN
ncbi:hypothetical protein NIES22_46970 [Calothrix brevissima NIES-22]|nr:hypothetical protein NIES22_46970 [Calothrix brevissima NIES-22]